ncbi:MAG TPA: MarR family transcriptional regulator [Longimicrobiales bacterium]
MGLLFEALDDALGTTSKVRLLRALLRLPHAVTGREAARLAGVSQTAARRALDDLVALGILERTIGAGEHRYVLNRENVLVRRALPPLFAAEDERSHTMIEAIRDAFTGGPDAPGARPRAVAALDAASPHDPVTLVIVVATKAAAREVEAAAAGLAPRIRNRFGLRLEFTVLSLDRLRELYAAGDAAVRHWVAAAIPVSGDPLERLVGTGAR